ncbi:MAG TPA: hypothetical protein DCY35_11475, partial [Prolixibacteraceae bacterium]|nr:hypothetical protein [Prolixibacteraceae bacterium]
MNLGATLYLGIDLGSTTTKAIIVDKSGDIKASHLISSGNDFRQGSQSVLTAVLQNAGIGLSDIKNIVITGYGRYISGIESKVVSEITCCGRGAFRLHPATRTIIDVGGQDSKCIKINERGKIIDFALNDKCAAGTGRFLERIATSL